MKNIMFIISIILICSGCSKATTSNDSIDPEIKTFVSKYAEAINNDLVNDTRSLKSKDFDEVIKFLKFNDPEIKQLNSSENKLISTFGSFTSVCMNVSGTAKIDVNYCSKKKKEIDEMLK